MKNRRITVSFGLTKNLGNMDFVKLNAGMEGDVRRKENRDEEWDKAWREVELQISKELGKVLPLLQNTGAKQQ